MSKRKNTVIAMSYGSLVGRDEEGISFETACISERLLRQPSHFPA